MVLLGAANCSMRFPLVLEEQQQEQQQRLGGAPGGAAGRMISEALAPRLLRIAQGAAEAAAAAAAATTTSSTSSSTSTISTSSSEPRVVAEGNGTRCGEEILSYGRAEKVVIGGALAALTLSTICGNLLVVISVCFVKKLRQPSNYLIVSLALADLSVALAVMPFVSVTDLIGGRWVFGQFFCNVFIAMDVMCCTASIMSLCVISIDR